MKTDPHSTRRNFLRTGGIIVATSVMGPAGTLLAKEEEEKEAEVSPPEDLMREHGVLKRVLLVYGEALRRLEAQEDSAKIIREFVEDYHEKLEENYLFPRFKKAGKLVDLVDVLVQQHQAGRRLTDTTLRLATAPGLKNADDRRALAARVRP